MKLRALAIAALACATVTVYAQNAGIAIGDPGVNGNYLKISDFGMSRWHDTFEAAQNSLRTYRPGRPVFGNITFKCGIDTAPDMDEWINSFLQCAALRKSGSVIYLANSDKRMLSFSAAYPVKWSAPECDSSKRTRSPGLCFDVVLGDFTDTGYQGQTNPQGQKAWLPANFRLKIDGLDAACSRVNKIEAITVKQVCAIGSQLGTNYVGGDLDGDGLPDLAVSDLVFTLPLASAQDFAGWFGNPSSSRQASIDYLDEWGVPMHRLSFDCCIQSIGQQLGSPMATVTCTITGRLVWSPRSN